MQFLKKPLKGKIRKIGSLLLVLFVGLIQSATTQNNAGTPGTIQLRVASESGKATQQLFAEIPFFIEVIATGTVDLPQRMVIPGLDQGTILHQQQSTHMYLVNGVRSQEKKLSYLVRFDRPQQVQIGPVEVVTAQGNIKSNSLKLTIQDKSNYNPADHVVDDQKPTSRRGAQKSEQQADEFAIWSLAKKTAFKGEAIPYTLRFYYTDSDISGITIAPITMPTGRMVPDQEVRRGSETKKGIQYQFLEWSGVIYPREVGPLVLPRVLFEYAKPQDPQQASHWGNIMGLFSGFLSRQQRVAESVRIAIKPLPEHDGVVTGVGVISDVHFAMATQKGAQGDPLVGTLSIVGNFDTEALAAPSLVLPRDEGDDVFKVYTSQVRATGTFPKFTQAYEYILQGLKAGVWQIPEQTYTFFNPELEEYQTFTTSPYSLEITPGALSVAPEEKEVEGVSCNPMIDAEVHAVDLPWKRSTVPFGWFLLGLVLPLLWWVIGSSVVYYVQRWVDYVSQRYALWKLRRNLKHAMKTNNGYEFFKAVRDGLYHYNERVKQQFSVEEQELWKELFDEAAILAFSTNQPENHKDILSSCYHKVLIMITLVEDRIVRKS